MNKSYEREIIIVSFYTDLIQNILKEHEKLSVLKILVFSFLMKKQKLTLKIYNSNNKNNVMLKLLSQLSGEFMHFINDLEFLFKSIDILVKSNKIEHFDGILKIKDFEYELKDKKDLVYKAINESKYYSNEQFMREVLYYV
jgi:hypothetical protein